MLQMKWMFYDAEEKGIITKRQVLMKVRRGEIQEFTLAPSCMVV